MNSETKWQPAIGWKMKKIARKLIKSMLDDDDSEILIGIAEVKEYFTSQTINSNRKRIAGGVRNARL